MASKEIFMRCKACNDELTDHEATWKDFTTGEFYDLCAKCWSISRTAELESELNSCYTSVLDTQEEDE